MSPSGFKNKGSSLTSHNNLICNSEKKDSGLDSIRTEIHLTNTKNEESKQGKATSMKPNGARGFSRLSLISDRNSLKGEGIYPI
jgi:hypothetical protein